uniref:Uncharacterized protein n=1 Tax=Ceratitis capitata TaxID=7213 RepID=W8C9Y0_CERCA
MSRYHNENLIDLSMEDEMQLFLTEAGTKPDTTILERAMNCPMDCPLPKGESVGTDFDGIDNNPFDLVQKLATRPADPFDIVEKEAYTEASHPMQTPKEVKEGKLLSLSDDNIIDDDSDCQAKDKNPTEICDRKGFDATTSNCSSSVYQTALFHDIESESPPVSMSIKSTPDSCSSAIDSDEYSANSAEGYSAKIRKALENRKRLLKLSIANSTFNSPLNCRPRQWDSGFSAAFSAAAHFSDYILATESPLKLVDDDLITEEAKKLTEAENDFEADLQMLSIPMLRELPSIVPEETSIASKEANAVISSQQNVTPPDINAIREKLREKRMNTCKEQDVVSLIDNLKSLMCDNDIVDDNKKTQANCLLKKLSAALNTKQIEDSETSIKKVNEEKIATSTHGAQTIKRQGTFDMELQSKINTDCDKPEIIQTTVADSSHLTHSLQSTQSLSPPKEIPESMIKSLSPPKDIPETMIKSSATYDGEPITERENLLLPHVDTFSPNVSPTKQNSAATNPELNNIIEQISKLLEQHQVATQTANAGSGNNSNSTGNNAQQSTMCNPTFIVVVPSNSVQSNNAHNVDIPSCNDANNDINDVMPRRRSQSLSIHDKVKIVQLPLRPQARQKVTEEDLLQIVDRSSQFNSSTSEIKTPVRTTLRRNSFSSGTPNTPLTSLNHGAGVAFTRKIQNASVQSRYSLGTSKLQDRDAHQQAVVHPITRSNLNVFKPDLKKKSKQQTAKTSIMASNGPLKAVIPIKKVAPMLTVAMATPERSSASSRIQFQKVSMETSMHLLTTAGKISHTSTPMPTARNSDQIPDFPNACSTPSISGAIKRPDGTVTKKHPRFSISTPTFKTQQAFTNNSGLKTRAKPVPAKPKSPVRLRNSLGGMTAPAPVIKGRQPLVKEQNVPKQTTSRLSTRLSTRSSICTGFSTNKENKKP